MKLRVCSKCGKRRPCFLGGPQGAPVCQLCSYAEEKKAEEKEVAS